MTKCVLLNIEDNTAKIMQLKELEEHDRSVSMDLAEEIDQIQKKNFLKMLAYIKVMTDDYLSIVGEKRYISAASWIDNYFDVANFARTIRICANKGSVFIDFNYMGSTRVAPKRMTAVFRDGEIRITASSREGINDLMNGWPSVKPEFQKAIDKALSNRCHEIANNQEHMEYLLNNAKKFEV